MTLDKLYELFRANPVITTDSRDCPPDSIFFALKGENFNGNQFAAMALDKGCRLAVVDEPQCATAGDDRYWVVDDVLETLRALARLHRRTLGTPMVGITGTNGKTTTKELVGAVLAQRYNVLYTQGNFNNEIGVPKTLLRLRPEHEIAVVEMGASHPGDIKRLVEIAEPDCGLITNVGRAHLQGFGSFEGVVSTKGELYDWLRDHRDPPTVFIHAENEHLMAISHGLHLIKYGTDGQPDLDVTGQVLRCDPLLHFTWSHRGGHLHTVDTHLIGAYNVTNLLAAVAVGLHYQVNESLIDQALAAYVPSNNRSQFEITRHNRLIVDAYNANPTSMHAALENFRYMEGTHKLAILGEMRELGEVSVEEHQKTVDYLTDINRGLAEPIEVWLVGGEFETTRCAFRKFHDVEAVQAAIRAKRPEGHYILIKGSNGTRLFTLPELL